MNVLETRDFIIDNLCRCNPTVLNRIARTIEKLPLDDARSYMLHETTDDYFYYILFEDGRRGEECIGRRAYQRFINNDDAIAVYRMDKDYWYEKHNEQYMELLERKKRSIKKRRA